MIRLYIDSITKNTPVMLTASQEHYLLRVMRLHEKDEICIFSQQEGEFSATLHFQGTKAVLIPQQQLRVPECQSTELHLAFSPLRPHLTHFILEKATELGVTHLHPVTMQRTQIRSFSWDKSMKIIIEAAEQSERMTLPVLESLCLFSDFLSKCVTSGVQWFSALERSEAPLLTQIKVTPKIGIIIGPEGGFSPDEYCLLQKQTTPVSLGKNILRSETAAISALSCMSLMLNNIS